MRKLKVIHSLAFVCLVISNLAAQSLDDSTNQADGSSIKSEFTLREGYSAKIPLFTGSKEIQFSGISGLGYSKYLVHEKHGLNYFIQNSIDRMRNDFSMSFQRAQKKNLSSFRKFLGTIGAAAAVGAAAVHLNKYGKEYFRRKKKN